MRSVKKSQKNRELTAHGFFVTEHLLLDLLFKRIKFRRSKKFPQRHFQSVTQLFDGYDRNIASALI